MALRGNGTDDALGAIERFFGRVWRVVTAPGPAPATAPDSAGPPVRSADGMGLRAVDDAVTRATSAIERLRFNVALAAAMEVTGWLESNRPSTRPD